MVFIRMRFLSEREKQLYYCWQWISKCVQVWDRETKTGRWKGDAGWNVFPAMPIEDVNSFHNAVLHWNTVLGEVRLSVLFSSVSISFPQSAGQLLEEHFPKRMMQHSEWPWGLLCSNLNQKSLTLSDGYLAVLVKGAHSSSSAPRGLLRAPANRPIRTELAAVQGPLKAARWILIHMAILGRVGATASETTHSEQDPWPDVARLECVCQKAGCVGTADCPVITHIRPPIVSALNHLKMKVKVTQSCLTLCDTKDYMIRGILQARILEWVAISFSRGSSQHRDWTQVSHIAGRFQLSHKGSPWII